MRASLQWGVDVFPTVLCGGSVGRIEFGRRCEVELMGVRNLSHTQKKRGKTGQ